MLAASTSRSGAVRRRGSRYKLKVTVPLRASLFYACTVKSRVKTMTGWEIYRVKKSEPVRVFKSSDICWGAVKMLCAGGGDSDGDGRGAACCQRQSVFNKNIWLPVCMPVLCPMCTMKRRTHGDPSDPHARTYSWMS